MQSQAGHSQLPPPLCRPQILGGPPSPWPQHLHQRAVRPQQAGDGRVKPGPQGVASCWVRPDPGPLGSERQRQNKPRPALHEISIEAPGMGTRSEPPVLNGARVGHPRAGCRPAAHLSHSRDGKRSCGGAGYLDPTACRLGSLGTSLTLSEPQFPALCGGSARAVAGRAAGCGTSSVSSGCYTGGRGWHDPAPAAGAGCFCWPSRWAPASRGKWVSGSGTRLQHPSGRGLPFRGTALPRRPATGCLSPDAHLATQQTARARCEGWGARGLGSTRPRAPGQPRTRRSEALAGVSHGNLEERPMTLFRSAPTMEIWPSEQAVLGRLG